MKYQLFQSFLFMFALLSATRTGHHRVEQVHPFVFVSHNVLIVPQSWWVRRVEHAYFPIKNISLTSSLWFQGFQLFLDSPLGRVTGDVGHILSYSQLNKN